jgi:hypothetical protein
MVVSAGRNEGRFPAKVLHQLKAQHTAVKRQRSIKVSYLQMDVADANLGMNRFSFVGHGLSVI